MSVLCACETQEGRKDKDGHLYVLSMSLGLRKGAACAERSATVESPGGRGKPTDNTKEKDEIA